MVITYSDDILVEPKHLDTNFFNDVLENALFRNNFQIKSINFNMGSCAGENYCSQIYRVKIGYKILSETEDNNGCISVIIKSMMLTEATNFLIDLNVFHKEKIFYNNVLPLLEVLCKDDVKFAPRLYHSLKTPVNTLVFEDLAESKYVMESRERGLDLAHSLMVMNKLGKYHAASIKLFKKTSELQKCFDVGMLAEAGLKDEGMIIQFFGGNLKALIELIDTWQGYEKIAAKIKNYCNNLKNNLRRSGAVEENGFCVLNHGDLWVNNMLFRYDEQRKPIDINFIDFQMSVWNSPGIDLNYFFYTSIELDLLKNKLEVLIREYHKSLSETMKELGLREIPSYQDIYNEVQKRQLYAFFANYGILPIVCQDKNHSQDSNMENFHDEEFAKQKLKKIFESKRLEATYRYTLKNFDKMGVFD